jgi:glutaredoxin
MLVGERKQVIAALLDPAGRSSLTSAFWSSRECPYCVNAKVTERLAVGHGPNPTAVLGHVLSKTVITSPATDLLIRRSVASSGVGESPQHLQALIGSTQVPAMFIDEHLSTWNVRC